MAGIEPTAADINYACGQSCLTLTLEFQKAANINAYLQGKTDQELIALGLDQAAVTLLKSAFADLAYMKQTAFDSSQNVKKLVGLGI